MFRKGRFLSSLRMKRKTVIDGEIIINTERTLSVFVFLFSLTYYYAIDPIYTLYEGDVFSIADSDHTQNIIEVNSKDYSRTKLPLVKIILIRSLCNNLNISNYSATRRINNY